MKSLLAVSGRKIRIIILSIFPILAFFISLLVGPYGVSPPKVLKILYEGIFMAEISESLDRTIIMEIRLPRIVLSGLTGACLSASGAVLQGIFRNPLVDPFILGISSGSALGAALSIAFFSFLPVQLLSFLFAILAVLSAYLLARTQAEVTRLPLVLSGIVVSSFFTAMVSIVKFLVDPHRLQSIVFWLMGSFSLADWNATRIALVGFFIGSVPLWLMRWRLNALSMGEEEAKALGVNVERERALFICFSTLAVSVPTSLCGIIGWVGLVVPHLVRMLLGPDHTILIPMSITLGSGFMILADTLSRTLTTFDIPCGIITSLLGAPFFIYVMRRGGIEAWGR